jgi:ABC-type Mn2+/Zn2+ transport system permease subunit
MSAIATASAAAPLGRPLAQPRSGAIGLALYLAISLIVGLVLLRETVAGLYPNEALAARHFATPLWTVAIGLAANVSCALLGCYLVLRRMSLLGDAISHAVLPGIVLAFALSGSIGGWPVLIGAMALGVLTSMLTQGIASLGRVPEDTSMGVVYTSLFALGVILIKAFGDKAHLDADCVLYGQIDFAGFDRMVVGGVELMPPSLAILIPALALVLLFIGLLWKELKIVAFDPALAAAMGLPVTAVHHALMAMVAGVSVAAFSSVGSFLVVAMLIVPAATAALLTQRLGWMLAWAAAIAAVSSLFGYVVAAQIDTTAAGSMAVIAGLHLAAAVFFAPRSGLVSRWLRNLSLAVRIAAEDVIGRLYRQEEKGIGSREPGVAAQAAPPLSVPPLIHWLAHLRLRQQGLIEGRQGGLVLTAEGRAAARSLVRAHRLWESYLDTYFDLPRDHLHDAAERMEHFLDPQLQAELDAELSGRAVDPHGKQIPSAPAPS